MSKWMLHTKKADFAGLGAALSVDQVVARIMVNRGLTSPEEMAEYLNPSLDRLPDPHLFADMDLACEILAEAIDAQVLIRVIGDYDVDGIMSTYILTEAIAECGGLVDYAIPRRIEDGYGVNPDMVERAYEDGVELIITCDNGIAAREAVERANELGISFVVTDHHEVPFDMVDGQKKYILPPAAAVVDPKRVDCGYPFKGICGAQVAWKLAYVLYEVMGLEPGRADRFMEFASIACVCDVMELKGENRALVYCGLKALEHTKNQGLHALLARTELAGKKVSCYHLGFVVGPCLNASGRLDTASRAIELLKQEDEAKALAAAGELVELNNQRKAMTQEGIDKANEIIANEGMENDRVLIVYIPDLHESLAGIVAGRIKEQYYRPTIVITDSEDGAKGSGRSIPAYNMFEELSAVKDIFTKFGGHPMAAGISLDRDRVAELRQRLNDNCRLSQEDLTETIYIDVPMPLSYITEELVEQLGRLEPFGNGNSKPLFALKGIPVLSATTMGRDNQYMRLKLKMENGGTMTGLLFRGKDQLEELIVGKYGQAAWEGLFSGNASGVTLDIIYQPGVNEFRDSKTLQITIENFK